MPRKKHTKWFTSSAEILRKRLFTRKTALIAVLVIILGLASTFIIPITYDVTENSKISYGTEFQDEDALELGIEQTSIEGKDGTKYTKYKYRQSLFDYLFRRDNASKESIHTGISDKPTDKMILRGTRKWQYMMCSNGMYRYFTDEQFKDPGIGFTSKSPDNCKENNEGVKVGLADSPSGANTTVRPKNTPTGCKIIDLPYKTVHENVSWLKVGETQDGYGVNGFKYDCTDGTMNIVSKPIDKVIYHGTGQGYSYTSPTTPSAPTQDYAAKNKCDGDYSRALAQLRAGNATNSSAMTQVQYLYQQCLSRAGF